jgi:hypothetical protein
MTTFLTIALAVAALAVPLFCAYLIVCRLAHRGRPSGRKPAEFIECVGCAGIESARRPTLSNRERGR